MLHNSFIKYCIVALIAMTAFGSIAKKKEKVKVEPTYAWTMSDPLGLQYPAGIDTLYENYHDNAIPSFRSKAFATTGNYGNAGQDQIFFDRKSTSAFFHADALDTWLPSVENHRFYNSRIPMTLLSHTTGGDKYSTQDRTTMEFSGNVNKRLAAGASLDYIYSKGSYENQAQKNFMWKGFASYLGDRYELQAVAMNFDHTNKENGGIVDDRYITDPAWRDDEYYGNGAYKFQLKLNLEQMRKELGDEYVIILGTHYYIADVLDLTGLDGFAFNLSKYDDITEIYLMSDILITDYSSVFFDFANLKRPMLFYTYDLDKYRDVLRGFYINMEEELPGPLVFTTDEVIDTIKHMDEITEKYADRYVTFYDKFCGWEDGHSSQRVVETVFEKN